MDIALRLSPLADPSWDHSTYEKFACKREVQWYDGSGRQTEVLSRQPRLAYSFGGRRKWILHGADVVHGRMYLTPNGVNIPCHINHGTHQPTTAPINKKRTATAAFEATSDTFNSTDPSLSTPPVPNPFPYLLSYQIPNFWLRKLSIHEAAIVVVAFPFL